MYTDFLELLFPPFAELCLFSFVLAVCCLSLRYVIFSFLGFLQFMNAFDRAMNLLDDKFSFLASNKQIVSSTNEEDKVSMPQNDRIIIIHNLIFVASQLRDCVVSRLIKIGLLSRKYT